MATSKAKLLKESLTVMKKLRDKKPLSITEYQVLKRRGLIKGSDGKLALTSKGKEFLRVLKGLRFI